MFVVTLLLFIAVFVVIVETIVDNLKLAKLNREGLALIQKNYPDLTKEEIRAQALAAAQLQNKALVNELFPMWAAYAFVAFDIVAMLGLAIIGNYRWGVVFFGILFIGLGVFEILTSNLQRANDFWHNYFIENPDSSLARTELSLDKQKQQFRIKKRMGLFNIIFGLVVIIGASFFL